MHVCSTRKYDLSNITWMWLITVATWSQEWREPAETRPIRDRQRIEKTAFLANTRQAKCSETLLADTEGGSGRLDGSNIKEILSAGWLGARRDQWRETLGNNFLQFFTRLLRSYEWLTLSGERMDGAPHHAHWYNIDAGSHTWSDLLLGSASRTKMEKTHRG